MAKSLFSGFDGTDRQPRPIQLEALAWVEANLSKEILALNLPTGAGKSAISKTIADRLGAHIITPANALVDQYVETYPAHNALKGKAHYTCTSGVSCQDWTVTYKQKACPNCPYNTAKARALDEPTFFNPMSLYYLTLNPEWKTPRTLVVDEAHTLASMLLMLCGMKLPYSKWRYPANASSELVLTPYLEGLVKKLQALSGYYAKADPKQFKEVVSLLEQCKLTLGGIREDAQNYAIYETEGTLYRRRERFLHINPLKPPRFVTQQLLDSRRLILMSGTLFKPDIEDLIGDRYYEYLDLPSPIPVENRRIYYKPAPFAMNFKTDPRDIVRVIETVLDHHPGQNTIIHVTYSMSEKIRPYFHRPIIFNTSADKDARIAEFKAKGGIFLAAGCAEGLDLPGDLCRLNIIPKMPFPDLGDITVQKRKALADGDDWYKLSTFKTLIQQCGRSTRNEKDFSKTFILDSSFSRNYRHVASKLPNYFKEAIVWNS